MCEQRMLRVFQTGLFTQQMQCIQVEERHPILQWVPSNLSKSGNWVKLLRS